jgi:hypothetical protein
MFLESFLKKKSYLFEKKRLLGPIFFHFLSPFSKRLDASRRYL